MKYICKQCKKKVSAQTIEEIIENKKLCKICGSIAGIKKSFTKGK